MSAALEEGFISYADTLPLSWIPLAIEPGDGEREHLHDQNLRMLATVATLEERRRRPDVSDERDAEIERLHHKMDAMLELAGALLRVHQALPEPMPVRFSRQGVCWTTGSEAPAHGERVRLSLHLHPCVVHPFSWYATVERHGGEGACARFDPLGDVLEAALERHVFLHHRRSVAGARQPGVR